MGEDEEVVVGGGVDGEGSGERGRKRSDTGGNGRKVGDEEGAKRRTGRKKGRVVEKEIAEIDILYENQRG